MGKYTERCLIKYKKHILSLMNSIHRTTSEVDKILETPHSIRKHSRTTEYSLQDDHNVGYILIQSPPPC